MDKEKRKGIRAKKRPDIRGILEKDKNKDKNKDIDKDKAKEGDKIGTRDRAQVLLQEKLKKLQEARPDEDQESKVSPLDENFLSSKFLSTWKKSLKDF